MTFSTVFIYFLFSKLLYNSNIYSFPLQFSFVNFTIGCYYKTCIVTYVFFTPSMYGLTIIIMENPYLTPITPFSSNYCNSEK